MLHLLGGNKLALDKVAILIKRLTLNFDKMSNPILKDYGLTSAQYKIIKYLYINMDVPVRQVDIERFYSLTHPTTIGLLDQLESKGFITREVNPDDARSRIIKPTQKALNEKEVLEGVGDQLEKRLTVALNEKEYEEMVVLLKKMLSAFE